MTYDALRTAAMLLSAEERCQLADELYLSLGGGPELTPAQREDLQRRLEEVRSGKATLHDWADVREQLKKG